MKFIGTSAVHLSPAGPEEFFAQVGVPVATRTTAPPQNWMRPLRRSSKQKLKLTPKYKTELLQHA
jgi:hypothetical protein